MENNTDGNPLVSLTFVCYSLLIELLIGIRFM